MYILWNKEIFSASI